MRFTWLDADSEFAQCVYVRGANDDKVLLMPRGGLLGEPPKVQAYPPAFAVLFQKARNPITDFGPRRMIERTLDRIARARKVGEVRLAVRGLALVGPSREPCVHVELRYPKGDPFPCKLQDLFIHSATFMPVASYLWLPGKVERCQQTLDGMYVYSNVTAAPTLGDEAFVLDPVARESKGAMGTRQADLRRRRARSQGLAATPPTAGHRSARRATLEDTGSRE